MKKLHATLALSLASLAVVGCGTGDPTPDQPTAEPSADPSPPSLGTANGEDIEDVDVKMNPNMQHSAEEMTGEEELKELRPEPTPN